MKRLNNYTTIEECFIIWMYVFPVYLLYNGQTNHHNVHKQSTVNPDLIIKFSGEGTKESSLYSFNLNRFKTISRQRVFRKITGRKD